MDNCPNCKLPRKMYDPKDPSKTMKCGNRRCEAFGNYPYLVVVLNTPYGTNFNNPLARFQLSRKEEAEVFLEQAKKHTADNEQCSVTMHEIYWQGNTTPGLGKYAGFWAKVPVTK